MIYQIVWHEGKRRRRKTRSNLGVAKREAERIAIAIHNQRLNQLNLDAASAQEYKEAIRTTASVDATLTTAVREYAACSKLLPDGITLTEAVKRGIRQLTVTPVTVKEAHDRLMKSKEAEEVTSSWKKTLRSRLKPFVNLFGERLIGSLNTAELDEFLQSAHVEIRTRNNLRESVVNLFNFGCNQGFLPRDMKTEADYTARPKERPKETEIFTIDEIEALFTHALNKHAPYLAIGCFAGIRTEEIKRLAWEDFDWEDKVIRIEAKKAKTKATRFVPILPALAHALKSHRRDDGPIIDGKIHDFGNAIAKRAGISWKKNGLRHSFASYRLPILKDPAKVAMEMGNSADVVIRNYRRLVKAPEAKRYWKIRADKLRKQSPTLSNQSSKDGVISATS